MLTAQFKVSSLPVRRNKEKKRKGGEPTHSHICVEWVPLELQNPFLVFPESFSFIQISVKLHTVSEKWTEYTVVDETMTLILYRSSFDKTATCFFRHVNPSDITQTLSWQIIM